jgi:2-polyprenyl-6-methoxyphenol hydroxylase-like FAD-dependent oxidoreductase
MSASHILIAGAGPTGLVLALRLAHHGIPFRIIDKNSGPGQASRAMFVQARTLEFYQQLGFADEVAARGIRMETVHLRESGEEVAKVTFKDLGEGLSPFPFVLCFPQDDHERFLVEKLEAAGIAVEWGVELKEFTQDDTRVRAVLDRAGTEEICEVAYLCGCDGIHSRVRDSLALDFPGGTYDQLFYVADVKTTGAFSKDMFANLGAHGLGLMLPVRSSGMQRLIGIVPEDLAWRTNLTFEDIRPTAEPLLGIRVEEVNWFSTYHVHHRVAAHFRVGRCFIAGDAGHSHSPAGGQGMNTGIGDAVNLSWKLANVIKGQADPFLLDTYESERIAFARKLVATTDRAFQGMVGRGRGSQFLRTWLMPHLMPFLTGFSAVRRTIFNTVSRFGSTITRVP